MHVDRANEIAMAAKSAVSADPISAPGFLSAPTCRTPARCPSFGAGEAQDAGLFGFIGEVVDVASVFPQGHALVVVSAFVGPAHAVRVADEEGANLLLLAKLDHLPRGLMAQVAHAPLDAARHPVLRQLLVAHVALTFEAPNAAPGDDEGRTRVGGHGGQMDFSQVYRGADAAGGLLRLRYLDADMQFEAAIPDQGAGPTVLWQIQMQDQRGATSPHW